MLEIPKHEVDEIGVSSTKIREFISEGWVDKASVLMGHPYSIEGKVISGDKIGREIGFPTANISLSSSNKLIPPDGVFVVKVEVNNLSFEGMLYIGNRPTLEGKHKTIEVNIFGFDADIYEQVIRVDFLKMLRGDLKLENLASLKKQLEQDQIESQNYFKNEYRKA